MTFRSTLFYDANDTSYYFEPNGTSYPNVLSNVVARSRHIGSDSGYVPSSYGYDIYQVGGAWSGTYPDLAISYHTGIKFAAEQAYEGTRIYTNYDMSSRVAQIGGSSAYIYIDRWINVLNAQGILSSTNSAQWYVNNGTYGSWKVDGTRNGWYGIQFNDMNLMANATACGFHKNTVGWYSLYDNSNTYVYGEIYSYWSDRRLKDNIRPLNRGEGLEMIKKLHPSEFEWNNISSKFNSNFIPGTKEVAVIAQEVQEVLPVAVAEVNSPETAIEETGIEKYLTIKYDRITPYIVQGIKDLKSEIVELQSKLSLLKQKAESKKLYNSQKKT